MATNPSDLGCQFSYSNSSSVGQMKLNSSNFIANQIPVRNGKNPYETLWNIFCFLLLLFEEIFSKGMHVMEASFLLFESGVVRLHTSLKKQSSRSVVCLWHTWFCKYRGRWVRVPLVVYHLKPGRSVFDHCNKHCKLFVDQVILTRSL